MKVQTVLYSAHKFNLNAPFLKNISSLPQTATKVIYAPIFKLNNNKLLVI